MPIALQTDKELIKALVIQGTANKVICEKFGIKGPTLQTWINRYGWRTLQTKSVSFLKERHEPIMAESVAKASIAARNRLAEHLVRCVDRLEDPKTERKAMEQQADLEPLVRNAEKLFQWSQASQSSLVNVSSLSRDMSDTPPAEIAPVIDTSTSVSLPDSQT